MSFPKQISKRNKRGITVLIILLAAVTMFPRIYGWYKGSNPITVSVEELEKGVGELETRQLSSIHKQHYNKAKKFHAPPSRFNPNEYTAEDWMLLGLSEKQTNVVLKFTKRGIKNNDQLKQIFVIDDALFQLIKDSTFYPETHPNNTEYGKQYTDKPIVKIELNTATAEELVTLPGIGDYYAKNIIEYREKLGGYTAKEQLLELYRFDEIKLSKIRNNIDLNTDEIRRICINTCTTQELAKHPYISWNVANSIVKMRGNIQKYTDLEQLLESELIDKDLLEKIRPYLTLN